MVAFYLFGLGWPLELNAFVVLAFSVAVFVPLHYLYPSRLTTLAPCARSVRHLREGSCSPVKFDGR